MEDNEKILLERMRMQLERLVSNAESEKETARRMNNVILERIEKVDSGFKDMFYGADRKSGIVVDVDRLKQESKALERFKVGVWTSVVAAGGLLIKELLKLIMK